MPSDVFSTLYDHKGEDTPSFFRRLILNHKLKPHVSGLREGPAIGRGETALPRWHIPYDVLGDNDLKRMGFLPSFVAVPEVGQEQWRSWRHPKNNLHLHKHQKGYMMHEDRHPSLSMALKNIDKNKSIFGKAKDYALAGGAATAHVMLEGVPGYMSYINSKITGERSLEDRTFNPGVRLRSPIARPLAVALSSGLLAGGATGNARLGGAISGGVLGFSAGMQGSDMLDRKIFSGTALSDDKKLLLSALAKTGLGLGGMTAGGYVGRAVGDRLSRTTNMEKLAMIRLAIAVR